MTHDRTLPAAMPRDAIRRAMGALAFGAMTAMAALLATATITSAYAHSDAQLDEAKAPNGGQLRMAGPLHLELVLDKTGGDARARPVAVYVTDHAGQPLPVAGATGTVTLMIGKTRVSVPLKAEAGNRLAGSASYVAGTGTKAVVSVTMPGQETQQARFTPMDAQVHTH